MSIIHGGDNELPLYSRPSTLSPTVLIYRTTCFLRPGCFLGFDSWGVELRGQAAQAWVGLECLTEASCYYLYSYFTKVYCKSNIQHPLKILGVLSEDEARVLYETWGY